MDRVIGAFGASPFKAFARDFAKVAADPRTQHLAVTAAQAYAPQQTAQAAQYAQAAANALRAGKRPPPRPMMMPAMPNVADDGGPVVAPVKRGNFIAIAAIAGAGLLALLLLKR
jgi:hypothetical protein